ncbi:MAG: 50S ribosomal protein L23 [Candidatus Portnoybacteria bacterium]|nr:50S ribosomal protein L23 [Candidatus Portnoybacteria bacterium]
MKSPHITEKAVGLGAQNKYVFKVSPDANGAEAKKAIQELYGVRVENVNIIKIPRKKRRVGRNEWFKPGYKKIIVTLREGDKIETGV